MKYRLLILLTLAGRMAHGQIAEPVAPRTQDKMADDSVAYGFVPFADRDVTWINGQNHQHRFPLTTPYFTGGVYVDTYYSYNLANPKDNTQTISLTVGRHNEFTVSNALVSFETAYKNILGRLSLQTGAILALVQQTDPSVSRGRKLTGTALQNIGEASAGYHFNYGRGINVEMGLFFSYIGLESYLTQENWNYQRAMVSEFIPFYLSGMRVQCFPGAHYRMAFWAVNGWNVFGKWNQAPGLGWANLYRPTDNLQLAANVYYGTDTRQHNDRRRFHHDHSAVWRYRRGKARGINQAALSINNHAGFEWGGYETDRFTGSPVLTPTGRTVPLTIRDDYFLGSAIAHRLWFARSRCAITLRGDVLANGDLYESDSPGPYADRVATFRNARVLRMAQGTATFDVMPNDFFMLRLEYVRRWANVPYFAGTGGTTSPSGYADEPAPADWVPDQVRTEDRLTVSAGFRF